MTDRARLAVVLDGTLHDSTLVGGKAASLDRLIAWGERVPPTAVATAEAFRAVTAQPALGELMAALAADRPVAADDVDASFRAAGLPGHVLDAVMHAAATVGGGRPLAVRSSATVEDMAHSSFAGQYRSLLGIESDDRRAVERAVLDVFASLFHPAPRAYRDALGVTSSGIAMAAVMMAMVDASRAGVLFTLDPTVVEPMVRVEVVDGLGESLVSGKRTPRVHQFPRTSATGGFQVAGDIDPVLIDVVRTGLDIEQRAGTPQDIEWAWDGRDLWIVQARPVTARRADADERFDEDPFDDADELGDVELTTEGIGEMLPDVLPPLVWQTASYVVEEGFRSMLDRLGGDLTAAGDHPWLLRRIGGRAALDVDRLSAVMVPIPGAAERVRAAYFNDEPDPERAAAAAAAPDLRERLGRRWRVVSHLHQAERARRRASFDAEVVLRAVGSLDRPDDLSVASSAQLLARHLELIALGARAMAAELTVSADAGAIHAAVRALLTRYLDPDDASRWTDVVTVPPPLPAAFRHGSAAVFAGPTWDELGLQSVERSPAHDPDSVLADLESTLESAPRWPAPGLRRRLVRRRLEHLVLRARRQFGRREATKAAILVLGGEIRRIHLEVGARLVATGRLRDRLDVDVLSVDELRGLLRGGRVEKVPSLREIDRRRRVVQRQRADAPLPSRWRGRPQAQSVAVVADGDVLTGWAVSGGRFVGRARHVTGPEGPIGRDEVLVAAATDPSWSPVLLACGAMVLERGGPLSHAAILAREFGLPAICNVAGAVQALDGRVVVVDGDAGTVTVLDDSPPPEVAR